LAEAIAAGPQADVIVAAAVEPDALARLVARRKSTRILSAPPPEPAPTQVRSIGGSVLIQEGDRLLAPRADWTVVTKVRPTEDQWRDLVLAWRVCARTTSNAVVVVTSGQASGIGAGQQSRVGAAEIAVAKAGDRAKGGAGASDAFFPFPDGLEVLARAGVAAVIHPGGSVGDATVIEAADASGIALVATGERHFRH
jgi:phosphoribosylaminoimidazolecarboxamide formyltransferase/IMP cyclohydrolase